MQQFSLDIWLQNKNRKVVTRDGREVRIICTDRNDENPIVALINEGAFPQCPYIYNRYGKITTNDEDMQNYDLFFVDEEEEPTEFESKLADLLVYNHPMDIESAESIAKKKSKQLLDLARKELQPEFDKEMDKMLAETDKVVYQKGKQDALKDLPKWKKSTENKKFDKRVCVMDYYTFPFLDTEVNKGDYYIELSDLKTLPKEE